MYLLDFKNVGRDNESFTEKTNDLASDLLESLVKKNTSVMSTYIDFVFKSENDEFTVYNIVAGFHTIGTLEIRDLDKED